MAAPVVRGTLSRTILRSVKPLPATISTLSSSSPSVICRNIALTSSIPPRRGMITQPLAMGNPYYEEEQLQDRMSALHSEAMEVWREEAKSLLDLMLYDDIQEEETHPKLVNKVAENQVKSVFQELIDDNLLDPRLEWTTTVEY